MEGNWEWAVYGKHPVIKDYFKLGQYGSLIKIFSEWVDSGYQQIAPKKKSSVYSWRFWARGLKRDGMGCGVVRDSRDQLARPYPLLIMGAGPLAGWEDQWDLIPLACERTWTQMEFLCTKTLDSLKQLEEETRKIPPPFPSGRSSERRGRIPWRVFPLPIRTHSPGKSGRGRNCSPNFVPGPSFFSPWTRDFPSTPRQTFGTCIIS